MPLIKSREVDHDAGHDSPLTQAEEKSAGDKSAKAVNKALKRSHAAPDDTETGEQDTRANPCDEKIRRDLGTDIWNICDGNSYKHGD